MKRLVFPESSKFFSKIYFTFQRHLGTQFGGWTILFGSPESKGCITRVLTIRNLGAEGFLSLELGGIYLQVGVDFLGGVCSDGTSGLQKKRGYYRPNTELSSSKYRLNTYRFSKYFPKTYTNIIFVLPFLDQNLNIAQSRSSDQQERLL